MIGKVFFLLNIWMISTTGNDEFHFGIINHHTQWIYLCPKNNTKILPAPSSEQPLISYECPHQSALIEIIPIEIDFTFLCRAQSRLFWIIVDLYQYNSDLWLLNYQNVQIDVRLNEQIDVKDSKVELKNLTNRLIIIRAFYIPFEALESIVDQPIEIRVFIHNLQRSNQCQFLLRDIHHWRTFFEQFCHSTPSSTLFIQSGQCYFYSRSINTTEVINNPVITTTTTMTSSSALTPLASTREIPVNQTTSFDPYLLIEANYQQILASLARSSRYSMLMKLIFLFLILILVILTLFFLYMLCYHYYTRPRTSSSPSSTKNSSGLI